MTQIEKVKAELENLLKCYNGDEGAQYLPLSFGEYLQKIINMCDEPDFCAICCKPNMNWEAHTFQYESFDNCLQAYQSFAQEYGTQSVKGFLDADEGFQFVQEENKPYEPIYSEEDGWSCPECGQELVKEYYNGVFYCPICGTQLWWDRYADIEDGKVKQDTE